jgi:hypothetical protein
MASKRKPGRNIGEGERNTRRPNLRLAPTTLQRINDLAALWDCPKSYAVEVAIRLVHRLAEEQTPIDLEPGGMDVTAYAGDILADLYSRDDDGTEHGRTDIP